MKILVKISVLLSFVSCLVFSMTACSRHDYTTWHCSSDATPKLSMVLDGSQMRINQETFLFCGSLGPKSYFSRSCSAQTQDAPIRFTPSQGILEIQSVLYECKVL